MNLISKMYYIERYRRALEEFENDLETARDEEQKVG